MQTFSPAHCFLFKLPAFMLTFFMVTSSYAESAISLDLFLKDLRTFHAAFEQQLLSEYDEVLEKSAGLVYLRRPGMFHWAYSEPYAQQIISNGKILWVYDEDLEQVIIRDALESIDDTPAAILSGNIDIKDHYIIVELEPEEELAWLELTPRDIESQYRAVKLAFNSESLSAMILFDKLGQKTRIDFKKPQRNPKLARDQFQFFPPEGIDVIDNRQQ